MKNKKIISRVLAIFAVLVLMVSMALPAFADEIEQPVTNAELWEMLAQYYDSSNDNSAYVLLRENDFNDIDIYSVGALYLFSMNPSTIGEFYQYDIFSYLLEPGLQSSGEVSIWYVYGLLTLTAAGSDEPDLVYNIDHITISYLNANYIHINGYDPNGELVLYIKYSYTDGSYSFVEVELGDARYNFLYSDPENDDRIDFVFLLGEYTITTSDDIYRALTDDVYTGFHPADFARGYMSSYTSNRPDGVVPPSRTGMFGQIYYILYDAIYGSDAVIGTSQDFVLTQISTWMTYIVILLPLLVVAIFLWRVFAR